MIAAYLDEFLMITLVHMLAVISPGPDFAIVIRQSISQGRSTALVTSLGIASGISVHILYTLLGIGLIISQSPMALLGAQIAGALYLSYLGIKLLASKKATGSAGSIINSSTSSYKGAFMLGFMTNLLNPKVTLFFLAIFTTIVSVDTPLFVQSLYGVWIALTTALWFSLLSLLFSQQKVRNKFVSYGYIFERLMGSLLLVFAAQLAFSLL